MSFAVIRKPVFVAIATAAAFAAFNCVANAADDVPQVKVKYSALELDDRADAQRLYKRLQAAADRVCDSYSGRDLQRRALQQQCTTEALNRAVLNVNHPSVLALHALQADTRLAQKDAQQPPRG